MQLFRRRLSIVQVASCKWRVGRCELQIASILLISNNISFNFNPGNNNLALNNRPRHLHLWFTLILETVWLMGFYLCLNFAPIFPFWKKIWFIYIFKLKYFNISCTTDEKDLNLGFRVRVEKYFVEVSKTRDVFETETKYFSIRTDLNGK
jgi:hypothetical protein